LRNRIIGLSKLLHAKKRTGGRVHIDTIDIRSAILAIRVNLDRWRRQRYGMRKCDDRTNQRFETNRNSLIKLEKKSAANHTLARAASETGQ
jgi:hypothetical protein